MAEELSGTPTPTPSSGEPTPAPSPSLLGDPAPDGDLKPAEDPKPGEDPKPAEEPKPGDDPKPKEGAPEKYDFKAPEGQTFDSEVLNAYSEVARELNLTQEGAQQLLDKVGPIIEQRQMARIQEVRTGWLDASKTDKEFGGEKLTENMAVAQKALDFATPELKQLLNDTGFGNHPEIVRFFYRVGKAMSPDSIVSGRKEGSAAPKTYADMANKLYG